MTISTTTRPPSGAIALRIGQDAVIIIAVVKNELDAVKITTWWSAHEEAACNRRNIEENPSRVNMPIEDRAVPTANIDGQIEHGRIVPIEDSIVGDLRQIA
jgi:hypothetical protein